VAARTAVLSEGQLAKLAEHGEERHAAVGDVLFRVGDRRYPLIAIIEGEAAVLDQTGAEIIRHGASGFLGETNLLSGQTVFLTAVVTEPMRYIAVEREELRALMFEDSALSDLLLWTFNARREGLQARDGVGAEIVGPHSSEATRRLVEFARRNRLPFTWLDTDLPEHADGLAQIAGVADDEIPLVRLPEAPSFGTPLPARCPGHWGSGSNSTRPRQSTCSSSEAARPGSAPPSTPHRRGWTHSSSRAALSAARRGRLGGSRTTSASRRASAVRS
jgi:hypothetical protein